MPTYEYFCGNCGVFEEFHGMNETLEQCPKCGGAVRRLISRNSNIIFKGSGFHITDYRNSDYKKKVAAESNSGSSGSTSSKTDSKGSDSISGSKGSDSISGNKGSDSISGSKVSAKKASDSKAS
jgi:putative FmdB family regulatory protein